MGSTRRRLRGKCPPEQKGGEGERGGGGEGALWLACCTAPIPRTRGATPAVGQRATTQLREPQLTAFPQVAPPAPGSAVPVANLPGSPAAPRLCGRRDAVRIPRPPSSVLSEPARLCSQRPPELSWGLPRTLSLPAPPEPGAALSDSSLLPIREPLGVGGRGAGCAPRGIRGKADSCPGSGSA